MLLNLLLLSSAEALPTLSGKFKDAVNNLMPSQARQEYSTNCKIPLEKLLAVEESVGPMTKENLNSYEQAWINLYTYIGNCANVDSSADSALQAQQKEAVDKMYSVFITKHLIVDQYGQTGGYDPTTQNLFLSDAPFVESHYVCQPETMGKVDELINKSWLTRELLALEESVKGRTLLVEFENRVAADHDKYVAVAKKKSDDCLANKLEEIRAYTDAAPASVIKEWEGTVKLEFSNHTDLEIAKVVFPHSQFKRITETTREIDSSGTIREFHQDYDVMDAYVYVINDEFVDAYLVSCYKDYIKKSEYARFYGKGAHDQLRVSQRLLLKNFK